jgi:peptide/nickel transport system substrate-binding protein
VKPYGDARVRRALALAVDNTVPLELGISGRGNVSNNNYHVANGVHPDHTPTSPAMSAMSKRPGA